MSTVLLYEIELQAQCAPFHVNSGRGDGESQGHMRVVYQRSLIDGVFYGKWRSVWSERQSLREHCERLQVTLEETVCREIVVLGKG